MKSDEVGSCHKTGKLKLPRNYVLLTSEQIKVDNANDLLGMQTRQF